MPYPPPGPTPNGQPPRHYQVPSNNPPQQPPEGYRPPPGAPMGQPMPPGQFQPGPPPEGGQGKRTLYLAFGVVMVLVLALGGVVLLAAGVFDSDEEPTIDAAIDSTDAGSDDPTDAPTDDVSDTATDEAEPSEGASYKLLDDVCEVITPQVETYMTIDENETESAQNGIGGGSECYMNSEAGANAFDTSSLFVWQYADQEDPDAAAGDYEFNAGSISSSCTVTEDVEGPWEEAVFFYGSQEDGCALLGYTHTLLVHDGNMYLKAEIVYGDEEGDGSAELAVLTGLAEAITEAAAQ